MDEHALAVAFGLVEKRWSVSRANNEDLPTEASPRVTNFTIESCNVMLPCLETTLGLSRGTDSASLSGEDADHARVDILYRIFDSIHH